MRIKIKILLILLCICKIGCSQLTYIPSKYSAGEKFKMEVYYNWGFIWLNAGWVTFEIKDTIWNNTKAYHLYSEGSTYSGYDWFFKVRDKYEAVVEPKLYKPYWFRCNTQEGGNWSKGEIVFNYENHQAITQTETAKRKFGIDTLKITPKTTDLISAIYIARSIDFSKIKEKESVPISVIIDNEVFSLHFRYLGKEIINTKSEKKYKCKKFAVKMVEGTIFNGGEDLTAWVTDDLNNLPILVEAKILIGSVKAFLTDVEGNKWELKKEKN